MIQRMTGFSLGLLLGAVALTTFGTACEYCGDPLPMLDGTWFAPADLGALPFHDGVGHTLVVDREAHTATLSYEVDGAQWVEVWTVGGSTTNLSLEAQDAAALAALADGAE